MIYIIHKILVLFKNHLNDLKDNILKWFFKKYNRILFIYSFLFFKHIIMRNRRPEQEIILKDIGNLFRQKNP